jgi:hypothetical protein
MKVDKMKDNDYVWLDYDYPNKYKSRYSINANKFIETYKRDLKIVSCIDKDYSIIEITMAKARMEFIDYLLENIISKKDFLKLVD